MNIKRSTKAIAAILAAAAVIMIFNDFASIHTASANTAREEIERLKEERREIEQRAREVQARIDSLEFDKETASARKGALDDRIALTEMEIEKIIESIEYTYTLIEEKEQEVAEAQQSEDAHLLLYKDRVRTMEENGIISYLEIIFDSTSFSDLLARVDFVSDIMRADDNAYRNLIAAREATIAAKESLEMAKDELEDEKSQLEQKYIGLETQLDEANALITQLKGAIDTEQELYDEEMAAAERIQREINEIEAELRRQEEERRRQEEAARRANEARAAANIRGTGTFSWPVPGHVRVSSPYGNRMHPVLGVTRFHAGIDIIAPQGSSIIASDRGTVITSAFNSSYGNYVVISHGNGMTTLYAHMSSRSVSAWQGVEKGDVIGRIGSTGISTGPHLHFEISSDGARVDPLRYFSGWIQGW